MILQKKTILVFGLSFVIVACNSQLDSSFTTLLPTTNLPPATFTSKPMVTDTPSATPIVSIKKETEVAKGVCIGSFNDFAYFPFEMETKELIPPSIPPWKIAATLPYKLGPARETMVEITRFVNDEVEIWIKRRSTIGASQLDKIREFLIYRPNKGEWVRISAEVKDTEIWVDRLFVTSDGSLWGRNIWNPSDQFPFDQIPAMSKFNESTQQFEFDQKTVAIPLQTEENKVVRQAEIVLDEKNIFWIFVPKTGLFSYDPKLQKSRTIIELPDLIASTTALSPDGSIFFSVEDFRVGLQEGEIYQFYPENEQITPIDIPDEPWPGFGHMLVDDQGRLWLNTVGWRDPNGTWNLMYPNPEDYFKYAPLSFYWATPSILLESSNGYLWFNQFTYTHNGVAWYDPKTSEGCWVTNAYTNIVEDPNKNLWLVVEEKLYKLELNP